MKQSEGSINIPLVECSHPRKNLWRVRYNKQIDVENENKATWVETELNHKPTLLEIKDIIHSYVNSVIDDKILNDCEWQGKKIWLSAQNQTNLKASFDFAVMTEGANLPLKFKISESEDLIPIYHTFTTIPEITDMFTTIMQHIKNCIDEGWQLKDAIDWNEYEQLLNM